MLIFGSRIIGSSVMSIQTGTRLAIIKAPVINPGNLMIIAYEVEGPLLTEHPSYLRLADVRELSAIGMIIDSNDEFIGRDDVLAVKKLLDLDFKLIGIRVTDTTGHKIGKVVDYNVEAGSFTIQQLRVRQNVIKSLTNPELLIHRSQIVEINDKSIIVRAAINKLEKIVKVDRPTYINPFRSSTPQTNSKES